MKIGRHEIGDGHPAFVIAEIGVNHDGSVTRAIELVRHAAACGADAVKVQIFAADRLVHASAEFAEYQKSRVAASDPAAMLRQYELNDHDIAAVAAEAAASGLSFVATPFSPEDVAVAARWSAAIKIASPDLVNRLLLTQAVETGLPLVVSTGAATDEEIDASATWLARAIGFARTARGQRTYGTGSHFALLHCVSHYPVAEADANLRQIARLARFGVPVGYSDHTTELEAGAIAVAGGACLIEKHLTYDTAAAGPDHAASLGPCAFAEYVARVRKVERMLGRGGPRVVLPCEADVRRVSRQSLVTTRDLPAGHRLTPADLTTQRPGTGLSSEKYRAVIDRPLARAVRGGQMLSEQDVA